MSCNILDDVYAVTEPGGAVRFLNVLAAECKSKEELKTRLGEVFEKLSQLENDIKNDGRNIDCFYELISSALVKIPFFADDAVFDENISQWKLEEGDSLLMAQALLIQEWYDEIKPAIMQKKSALPEGFGLRLAGESDVAQLRVLVNRSYAELGDMGMNFAGVKQDEATTRDRMQGKEIWVIENTNENTNENTLVATIALSVKETETKSMFYISQFGVLPELKKGGLGSFLIHHSFERARSRGYNIIELDTAIPAHHLVRLYRQFGFEIVEAERRERPNYPNFLMDADVSVYDELVRRTDVR